MLATVAGVSDIGQPEPADAVTVAVVPLTEAVWKVSGLPTAKTDIPGLDNELRIFERRVGDDRLQQRMVRVEVVVAVARQCRGQVKPEAVDLHLGCPVTQTVEHQLPDRRVRKVERVSASCGVLIPAALVEAIVVGVIQTAIAVGQTAATTFGRVVVNHVENHLDAVSVQFANRGLQLVDYRLRAGRSRRLRRVSRMRSKEVDGVVAPIADQTHLHEVRL